MPDVDQCIALLQERGHSEYGGEPVTQLEHALQSALLAEQESAPVALIAAALLHDVGHLLHALPEDAPDNGIDDVHEELGYRYLKQIFPEAVTEPVRLHVPAKRYLCGKDKAYLNELSPPSVMSLKLQGGPMTAEDLRAFEQNPWLQDALRLRRWDDEAKIPDLQTPPLSHYAAILKQVANVSE